MRLFDRDGDFASFERVMAQTLRDMAGMRLLSYCLMPNHWHLVLWPRGDHDLANFMQRLTITHVRRWQEFRGVTGDGHVYQGRYKSFPIQADEHFLTVCRYVERNALRAGLVRRAEAWRWCSLWRRLHPQADDHVPPLTDWPVEPPRSWTEFVNAPITDAEVAAVRRSVARGRPLGADGWVLETAKRLGLEPTLRTRGRPRKIVQR